MAELQNINFEEVEKIKAIAGSENDHSLLMINLNHYSEDACYPDGTLYKDLSLIHISEPTRPY